MNRETLMSILKGAGLAVFGALVTAALNYVGTLNLTPEQAAALTATISMGANLVRKAIWPDSPTVSVEDHEAATSKAFDSGVQAAFNKVNADRPMVANPVRRIGLGLVRGKLRQIAKENGIDLTAAQMDAAVDQVQQGATGPVLLWILANLPMIIDLLKSLLNMSAEELTS